MEALGPPGPDWSSSPPLPHSHDFVGGLEEQRKKKQNKVTNVMIQEHTQHYFIKA